jgi:hypothetical protein
MDLSKCVQGLSDAAKAQVEEEAGSQQLLVSQPLVSCRLSDMRVVSFGYGTWRWYRGVAEVWEIYIWIGGIEMRVGEERGGKEMDRCPLTLLIHKDHQEVSRSALVKGMEWKMAAFI